jgi:hypothetical protein
MKIGDHAAADNPKPNRHNTFLGNFFHDLNGPNSATVGIISGRTGRKQAAAGGAGRTTSRSVFTSLLDGR